MGESRCLRRIVDQRRMVRALVELLQDLRVLPGWGEIIPPDDRVFSDDPRRAHASERFELAAGLDAAVGDRAFAHCDLHDYAADPGGFRSSALPIYFIPGAYPEIRKQESFACGSCLDRRDQRFGSPMLSGVPHVSAGDIRRDGLLELEAVGRYPVLWC